MSDAETEQANNIALVGRLFDALTPIDTKALANAFAEDAVFRRIPVGPLAGDFRGPDAIVDYFGQLSEQTDGTIRITPLVTTASGSRVFVLYRFSGTRNGTALDTKHVVVCTVAKGSITEVEMFASNFGALAAFWA